MCQSFGWDQTHVDRDMHSVFPKLSIQLLCSRAIKIWGSIWQVFSFGATPNLVSKLQVARKTVHLCPWPGGLQPQLVLALQSLKAWNPNILTTTSLTAIAMLLLVSVWETFKKLRRLRGWFLNSSNAATLAPDQEHWPWPSKKCSYRIPKTCIWWQYSEHKPWHKLSKALVFLMRPSNHHHHLELLHQWAWLGRLQS